MTSSSSRNGHEAVTWVMADQLHMRHYDSPELLSAPPTLKSPKHLQEAWCEKGFSLPFLCHDPASLEVSVSPPG